MIDAEIIDIATRRVAIDFAAQDERVAKAVREVKSSFIVVGLLASSMAVLKVEEVYVAAIKERVALAWEALRRCLEADGANYFAGLAEELKTWVQSFVPVQSSAFGWNSDEEAVRLKLQNMELYSRDTLRRAYVVAHEHVAVEIDQFVLSLKKVAPMKNSTGQVLNITGSTIANLQTGAGATATVTQTVLSREQSALITALKSLKLELLSCQELPSQVAADTVDLIEDSVKETEKANPNRIKLGACVKGIVETVDGVADLAGKVPAAVAALSSAAAALRLW